MAVNSIPDSARVIVLEQLPPPADGTISYRVAFWATVPATRQSYWANAAATSSVLGISAAKLTAIQAGQVAERVETFNFAAGTGTAAIQAALASLFNAWQANVNTWNPWNRYGTTWDGTTWTAQTVA